MKTINWSWRPQYEPCPDQVRSYMCILPLMPLFSSSPSSIFPPLYTYGCILTANRISGWDALVTYFICDLEEVSTSVLKGPRGLHAQAKDSFLSLLTYQKAQGVNRYYLLLPCAPLTALWLQHKKELLLQQR